MEKPFKPIIEMDTDILQVHKYTDELSSLQDYELRILIAKYFADNQGAGSAKKTGTSEINLSLAEEIFESISTNLGGEIALKNAHKCQNPDFIRSHLEEIRKECISSIQKILKTEFNATERMASQIAQARARAQKILMSCSN